MKKFTALVIVLLMTVGMCACEMPAGLEDLNLPPLPNIEELEAQEAEPTEEPTPEPEETPAPVLENQVLISTKRILTRDYDPAENEKLILTFSYDTPFVYIEGRDEAAAKINEYIAMLDETYYTGNDYGGGTAVGYNLMLEMAQDNYSYIVNSGAEGINYEFAASRSSGVERADSKVISLLFNDYVYSGGAHGEYGDTGYVFDAETGELLTLDRLSSDYDAFADYVVQYISELAENDESYAEGVSLEYTQAESYSDVLSPLLRDGSWYLDSDGLVIFSDLYELAPYAAGIAKFMIPYEQLRGLMDDKWFPVEYTGECDFSVVSAENVTDGTVVTVDRVTVDNDGEHFYLVADGNAYNVSIKSVEYSNGFYEIAQHWYCSFMQDSAVQIDTAVPEGMPNLMISYSDASGNYNLLITQSGEDGSIILADDSIEAVG